jgi:hypothetical protein
VSQENVAAACPAPRDVLGAALEAMAGETMASTASDAVAPTMSFLLIRPTRILLAFLPGPLIWQLFSETRPPHCVRAGKHPAKAWHLK